MTKVNLLKSILPIFIIIHHIFYEGYKGLDFFDYITGNIVMSLFFAMSGYGIVISYLKDKQYLDTFLCRSLKKLFIPYLITFSLFIVYSCYENINPIVSIVDGGLVPFVPTSWYIWVLSYFYVSYWIVFRYIKTNTLIKVLLVSLLVIIYCIIAHYLGVPIWRYCRCPAFCIGMFFALFDNIIRKSFFRYHGCIMAFLLVCVIISLSKITHFFDIILYPCLLFTLMYIVKDFKETRISKFLSSICLEMFIIQFLPIYIVKNNLHITSSVVAVLMILSMDVLFAYIMHKIVAQISNKVRKI